MRSELHRPARPDRFSTRLVVISSPPSERWVPTQARTPTRPSKRSSPPVLVRLALLRSTTQSVDERKSAGGGLRAVRNARLRLRGRVVRESQNGSEGGARTRRGTRESRPRRRLKERDEGLHRRSLGKAWAVHGPARTGSGLRSGRRVP